MTTVAVSYMESTVLALSEAFIEEDCCGHDGGQAGRGVSVWIVMMQILRQAGQY